MNFEHARYNMVEQQIRPWEVTSQAVRELLMTVRREDYVPEASKALAFADIEVPLPHARTMLKPVLEGRILQALALTSEDSVLEIGTGSGYFAALLAAGAAWVRTVEIESELVKLAQANLARSGVKNVIVEEGDGKEGSAAHAPYDAIVISGGMFELPDVLLEQLKPDGRLFAFVGEPPAMKARLVVRKDDNRFHHTDLFETVVPLLEHVLSRGEFTF
ncbi:protein-L-isoaspartate O-methyltransferase [Betaproteobacteria bacterium]|nr:protein-L-isoaspartate O-methyltransferase [Betaproteobacteria bacterium]